MLEALLVISAALNGIMWVMYSRAKKDVDGLCKNLSEMMRERTEWAKQLRKGKV